MKTAEDLATDLDIPVQTVKYWLRAFGKYAYVESSGPEPMYGDETVDLLDEIKTLTAKNTGVNEIHNVLSRKYLVGEPEKIVPGDDAPPGTGLQNWAPMMSSRDSGAMVPAAEMLRQALEAEGRSRRNGVHTAALLVLGAVAVALLGGLIFTHAALRSIRDDQRADRDRLDNVDEKAMSHLIRTGREMGEMRGIVNGQRQEVDKLRQLATQRSESQAAMLGEYVDGVAALSEQVAVLDAARSRLEAQVADDKTEENLAAASRELGELKTGLGANENEVERLRRELAAAAAAHAAEIEAVRKAMKEELAALTAAQSQQAQALYDRLHRDMREQQGEVTELRTKVAVLEAEKNLVATLMTKPPEAPAAPAPEPAAVEAAEAETPAASRPATVSFENGITFRLPIPDTERP